MDHKDLDVWKKSIDTVIEIYRLSEQFTKTEVYGLTQQLRRAAVIIPSNIAEGAARGSDKECIHFLYIAMGSLAEVETQVIIADRLGYIETGDPVLNSLKAVCSAGRHRFRPIILTTLTTFGGLSPMMFETSRQARFLIPMAISLGFGILFATIITLILVPALYLIVEDLRALFRRVLSF